MQGFGQEVETVDLSNLFEGLDEAFTGQSRDGTNFLAQYALYFTSAEPDGRLVRALTYATPARGCVHLSVGAAHHHAVPRLLRQLDQGWHLYPGCLEIGRVVGDFRGDARRAKRMFSQLCRAYHPSQSTVFCRSA